MRFTLIALFLLLSFLLLSFILPNLTHAETPPSFSPEIRLLFHGTSFANDVPGHEDKHLQISLAFWVIEPNLLDTNPQAQTTAGLRLERLEGWVEILGGAVFSPVSRGVNPVFDLRAFASPARHLHLFGEISIYGDALYGFAQADVPIRREGEVVAKIGVEGEGAKTWKGQGGFIAIGPHVIIPWNEHFATVITFQVRGTHQPTGLTPDLVGRIYAVIDL